MSGTLYDHLSRIQNEYGGSNPGTFASDENLVDESTLDESTLEEGTTDEGTTDQGTTDESSENSESASEELLTDGESVYEEVSIEESSIDEKVKYFENLYRKVDAKVKMDDTMPQELDEGQPQMGRDSTMDAATPKLTNRKGNVAGLLASIPGTPLNLDDDDSEDDAPVEMFTDDVTDSGSENKGHSPPGHYIGGLGDEPQKLVQFQGLPTNPPELTMEEDNRDHDSSSSDETDSSPDGIKVDFDLSNYDDTHDNDPPAFHSDEDDSESQRLDLEYLKNRERDVFFDEVARRKENKIFSIIVGGIAFFLLVVTIVFLVFFYINSKDPARPTRPPTSKAPTQPSIAPLPIPSPSPLSSPIPTPDSVTSSPTLYNDFCEDAIGPLSPKGDSIRGSLLKASPDEVDRCGQESNTLPGVWYYVYGTGGEMMAHTCNNTDFDTAISIFGGTCSDLQCLEIDDDRCGRQSAVSWESEFLEPYRILVKGDAQLRGSGGFQLKIEARDNDECGTAINLPVPSVKAAEGTTVHANLNAISCNGKINDSPSVFYRVTGTGKKISAAILKTDYSVKLSLLAGSCSNLQCIDQTEDGDMELTWKSVESETYYILVHGETADDVGFFAIEIG